MTTRWSRAMPLLAAALGLLLGVTLIYVTRDHAENERGARRGDSSEDSAARLAGLVDPAYPLGPEVPETTLDQPIDASTIPALRPQTPAASDESIAGVWLRSDEPMEIFFRYASGVEVALRRPDFADGFETFYKSEIEQGYPGELTQVSGLPVFVVPSDGAYIEADFVVADVFVQVIAVDKSLNAEDMTTLVESVIASAEPGG